MFRKKLGVGFAAVIFACTHVAWAVPTAMEEVQALLNQGQYERALKQLDRYLSGAADDAEARFTRGLVLVKLNRTNDALKAFSDLTRDYPQLPEPYNNLAVLYAQQGDYEKARDALEAALATHPSYATAHENLGDVYAALAGAAYNRALMLDQKNQAVRYKLSLIGQLDSLPASVTASAPKPTEPTSKEAVPAAPVEPSAAAAPKETPKVAVEATPAPATEPVSGAEADAIKNTLSAWAAAWSAKDANGYLALYADDFQPEGGLARDAWAAQRRERIAKPTRISVKVLDPQITRPAPDRVQVTFVQDYASDKITDKINKVLELRNVNGSWRIVREYAR